MWKGREGEVCHVFEQGKGSAKAEKEEVKGGVDGLEGLCSQIFPPHHPSLQEMTV